MQQAWSMPADVCLYQERRQTPFKHTLLVGCDTQCVPHNIKDLSWNTVIIGSGGGRGTLISSWLTNKPTTTKELCLGILEEMWEDVLSSVCNFLIYVALLQVTPFILKKLGNVWGWSVALSCMGWTCMQFHLLCKCIALEKFSRGWKPDPETQDTCFMPLWLNFWAIHHLL